jgi:hypothetical protein
LSHGGSCGVNHPTHAAIARRYRCTPFIERRDCEGPAASIAQRRRVLDVHEIADPVAGLVGVVRSVTSSIMKFDAARTRRRTSVESRL